jgi:hypothetical protein
MSKKQINIKTDSSVKDIILAAASARGKKIDPAIIQIFEDMAKAWGAPVVVRDKVSVMTGGMISTGYLANLDCRGEGPPEKIRIGRKIAYPLSSFLPWLMSRAEPVEPREA